MSSYNNLFILNSDNELEINKIEVHKIESLKTLMRRDTGSKGDLGGKKKYTASAEIYYIYLMYDIRSLYFNLPLEEREVKAKKDAKIPDNWKRDKEFDLAVKEYKEFFKLTASGNAFVVAEKSYYTITEDTREMQEELIQLKSLLRNTCAKLTVNKNNPMEIATLAGDLKAIMNDMTVTQKNIMANIKLFEELGNNVKKLSTKFIEEGGNLKTPVGGGKVNNREL